MKRQLKKQDFLSLFRKEAEIHIQELNKGLLELESDPKNRATLEEVRRRAHTLKGSARMMGFTEISNAAHTMEDLLESVRMEMSELDKSVFDRLFQGLDSISALLQEDKGSAGKERKREENKPEMVYAVQSESELPQAGMPVPPGEAKEVPSSVRSPEPQYSHDAILVRTDKLDSLAGVVSEMVLDQIKSENQMAKISQVANLMRQQVKLWSQIKLKMSGEGVSFASSPSPRTRGQNPYPGGPRLVADIPRTPEVLRLGDRSPLASKRRSPRGRSRLTNELLMEEVNKYNDLSASLLDDVTNLLDECKEVTTRRRLIIGELQDDIRAVRLIPISTVFDTFPRAVRDLSREYNKEIDLKVSGGEVELDKSIIEAIKDPLMHLVRNAVDHGIEAPEERLRRGKPERGNISLSAHHQGNKVAMEVSDDGAGIDLERVKEQAVKKGYIEKSQAEMMDEESAIQLIFLPGLSTSSIITDVSGRGVGMDVVMENIGRKLKGTVEVHTEAGKGTKVCLAVPITLAIMRGLLVRVGQETFAIPTESVEKNVVLAREQIKSVEGKQVIVDGDRIIPLVQLGAVLGVNGTHREHNDDRILAVIMNHSQRNIGFCVDGFAGEQEMVIKSLGSYLKRIPDVAGVTVLGNGDVVPILHVSDLVNSARNKLGAALIPAYAGSQESVTEHIVTKKPSILVVDDSLTTRELERNILEASGYDVHVAVDGLDGLSKVSERMFDLIISDIQMPRMDGFQMVEKLKQNDQYRNIPVVIVTALQKDEEKRRGIEVGASAYIAKSSFDQMTLLDTIEMLIG